MSHKTLRMMLLSALFAALTAVGAFIRLPAGPTSITLQFFFSALAGILLGVKWGWDCWGFLFSPWAAVFPICSSPASDSCWG